MAGCRSEGRIRYTEKPKKGRERYLLHKLFADHDKATCVPWPAEVPRPTRATHLLTNLLIVGVRLPCGAGWAVTVDAHSVLSLLCPSIVDGGSERAVGRHPGRRDGGGQSRRQRPRAGPRDPDPPSRHRQFRQRAHHDRAERPGAAAVSRRRLAQRRAQRRGGARPLRLRSARPVGAADAEHDARRAALRRRCCRARAAAPTAGTTPAASRAAWRARSTSPRSAP